MSIACKYRRLARLRQEAENLEHEIASDRKVAADIGPLTAECISILRQVMHKNHISQSSLAKMSGVRQPSISGMLLGKHSPTLRTVERLLSAAGADLAITTVVKPRLMADSAESPSAGERGDLTFVDLVRNKLKQLGMSQKAFAVRIGTSQQRVSDTLSGKHSPSLTTMYKFAEALGCEFVCSFRETNDEIRAVA